MLKLSFDLDGVIAEGRYVARPQRILEYMSLGLYDQDTRCVWNRLCREHEVFILTSRSFAGSGKQVAHWLTEQSLTLPVGILTMSPTHTTHADKAKLMEPLGFDAHFDDSPVVCEAIDRLDYHTRPYLMNNPGWQENQDLMWGADRIYSWKQIEETIETLNLRELQTLTSYL